MTDASALKNAARYAFASSNGPVAEACILDSAKAMAMTAIDLICDEVCLRETKAEFAASSVTPPARR